MSTSDDVCKQIVEKGYFVDWRMPVRQAPERPQQTAAKDENRQQQPMPVAQPVQVAQQQPEQKKDLGYLESLAMRNAQVRSILLE